MDYPPMGQSADFDIVDLGISEGTPLTNMQVVVEVDTSPISSIPTGTYVPVSVDQVTEIALGGPGRITEPGEPAGIKPGPNVPTNIIQHANVPSVQEEVNGCLPGSMARSIRWLLIGSPKTAQQIYDDLVKLMGAYGTKTYSQRIALKAAYLNSLSFGSTTGVLELNGDLGVIPGVEKFPQQDLITFLYQQLVIHDVELEYGNHIVTVTGIYQQGGNTYVRFRDDEEQGDNNKGDANEKVGKLTLQGGKYYFRRDPAKGLGDQVRNAIVETSGARAEPTN
jgi:hypothetical protein